MDAEPVAPTQSGKMVTQNRLAVPVAEHEVDGCGCSATTCDVCLGQRQHACTCAFCSNRACRDCHMHCECDLVACDECAVYCACGRRQCEDCVKHCFECDVTFCDDCWEAREGVVCGECGAVLTRTSRGLRAARAGSAYRPPACCTYQRHRAVCPGEATTVRTPYTYQLRAYRSARTAHRGMPPQVRRRALPRVLRAGLRQGRLPCHPRLLSLRGLRLCLLLRRGAADRQPRPARARTAATGS